MKKYRYKKKQAELFENDKFKTENTNDIFQKNQDWEDRLKAHEKKGLESSSDIRQKNKEWLKIFTFLLVTICVISSALAWINIESIMITGPIASIIGLLGYYVNRYQKYLDRFYFLIPLIMSISCFLLIFILEMSPADAALPISIAISCGMLAVISLAYGGIRRTNNN